MPDHTHDSVIADVARMLIAQVAPQELPLFRAISAAYFAAPDKPIKFEGGKDNPLGFGPGGTVTVTTPAILSASNAVVTYVLGAVGAPETNTASTLFAQINVGSTQQASHKALADAQAERVRLREQLDSLFSQDDIRVLCFDLGIDFDNLAGGTKQVKVQSLIVYCEQRGRVDDLIQRATAINPNMIWPAQRPSNNRLTTAQLAYVHEIALRTLKASMPDATAQQIANAFVGSLAIQETGS
jgi:hypothetical protein